MENTFRNIINSAAYATSGFVQKMYEDDKDGLTDGLAGVKFETTITILDENDMPIMVARATTEKKTEPEIEETPVENKTEAAADPAMPDQTQAFPGMFGYYPYMPYYMPGMSQMPVNPGMMPNMAPLQDQPVQSAPAVSVPQMTVPEPAVKVPEVPAPAASVSAAAPFTPAVNEPSKAPEPAAHIADPTVSAAKAEENNAASASADEKKSKIELLLKKYSNA